MKFTIKQRSIDKYTNDWDVLLDTLDPTCFENPVAMASAIAFNKAKTIPGQHIALIVEDDVMNFVLCIYKGNEFGQVNMFSFDERLK